MPIMNKPKSVKLFCALLCLALLSGCGTKRSLFTPLFGMAKNEIYSYVALDSKKTPLIIGVAENDDITALVQAFSEKYTDVQPMICYLQKGDASYSPAREWVIHGYAPDVIYNVNFGADNALYLEDLSNYDAIGAYYTQALEENDQDGRLYTLPGPVKIMSIAYNKTLFQRYGWSVPQTFDEFLALCDRITADTGGAVEPYNPNGKYATDFSGGMEAIVYGALFSGIDNRQWYQNLQNGTATFAEHMVPYFEALQKMTAHGILRPEHFTYSYTQRTENFLAGKIAMINIITDRSLGKDCDDEIGFMPFPASDGGKQYLSTRQSYNVSVVKKPRTTAQQKAVEEYLSFISTPEAQQICIGNALMLSSVNGTILNSAEYPAELMDEIENGQYFKRLDFDGGKVPTGFVVLDALRLKAEAIADGEITPEEAAADMDAKLQKAITSGASKAESAVLATVKQDFTVLETSEFIADAFRTATGAQIALIPVNSVFRGNMSRFFAGSLTENMLASMTPRSLENASSLVKVKMSGSMLLKALNSCPSSAAQAGNCVYAFSGLKATVAPWNTKGKQYLSVTLADGTEINPDETYMVAFWQGMVSDEDIQEVVTTYPGSYTDFMKSALLQAGILLPPADGRITLIWD